MHRRSPAILIGAGLAGLAAVVPVVGLAAAQGGTSKVVLREWSIAPKPATATAGTITFTVRNAGKARHEFVVIRTNVPAGKLPVKNGRASEKGQKGEIGSLLPGATKKLTLTLAKGKYVLICNLSGHYQAGQRAALKVT